MCLQYPVKHQTAARDDDVKSNEGQQGFGVEVYGCPLLCFCPSGQPPLLCACLITSWTSSAACAVAVIWSARCSSIMASSSASLQVSIGSRSSADVIASFSQWLVPGPLRICLPAASIPPAASAKPGRAPRHLPQPHTFQPRIAVAHTPQATRVAQKFCSAAVRQVARRARPLVCLGA